MTLLQDRINWYQPTTVTMTQYRVSGINKKWPFFIPLSNHERENWKTRIVALTYTINHQYHLIDRIASLSNGLCFLQCLYGWEVGPTHPIDLRAPTNQEFSFILRK